MKPILKTVLFAAIVLLIGTAAISHAQTAPKVWITWRATTYTPSFYTGRPMPVEGSKMVVALDVMDNGRVRDLSRATVYWYLNDKLLSGGVGLTRVAVTVPGGASRGGMTIRVALPESELAKTVSIPVVSPQVVVDAPKEVAAKAFTVRGYPYFFNVGYLDDLSFRWSIAGKEPAAYDHPDKVDVTLGDNVSSGFVVPVSLTVENLSARLEAATRNTSVIFDPK